MLQRLLVAQWQPLLHIGPHEARAPGLTSLVRPGHWPESRCHGLRVRQLAHKSLAGQMAIDPGAAAAGPASGESLLDSIRRPAGAQLRNEGGILSHLG